MRRLLYLMIVLLAACNAAPDSPEFPSTSSSVPETVSESVADPVTEPVVAPVSTNPADLPVADLVSVAVTGEAGNYTFAVTISSADTGCEQYADWWEVADIETGELLYRRILAHSHTSEQPITRSGGPVPITPNQAVIIRAHMGGLQSHYGGQV